VKLQSAKEYEEEHEMELSGSGQFNVVCDATNPFGLGGCGASTGFAYSKEEAIKAWNTRA